ncbi:hypothetical protein SU48_03315 [Deinococcus puniceus]|uniref:Uncharacterized protein n=1 Tax=Deinococcus puniceus TaxID=1182568 RepID=A0A172T7E8_9DEIO|nr:hypothetical protein SU48_03315 [Deinococcus puniceus]
MSFASRLILDRGWELMLACELPSLLCSQPPPFGLYQTRGAQELLSSPIRGALRSKRGGLHAIQPNSPKRNQVKQFLARCALDFRMCLFLLPAV